MNDTEFYIWFAGFWEGEGSLFKPKNSSCYVISIPQAIKNNRSVEYCFKTIQEKLGGSLKIWSKVKNNEAIQYRWMLYKKEKIMDILHKILPYLMMRKMEVIIALKYMETHQQRIFVPTEKQKELILKSNNDNILSKQMNWSRRTIGRTRKKLLNWVTKK